ncbi:MAG: hypothetical protein ACRETK_03255, partial [Steroidobacteraceae bacterium]
GFIAKFYAVTAGVGAHQTAPLTALVVGSILGLYYYLRLIVALIKPADGATPAATVASAATPATGIRRGAPVQALAGSVMAVLLVLLVALGVYPAPLVRLIRHTAVTLVLSPAALNRAAPAAVTLMRRAGPAASR